MTDLPTVPRRNVTTEAAKSRLSAGEIAAPFAGIGDALAVTGNAVEKHQERVDEGLISEKRNAVDLGIGDLQRQYAGNPKGLQQALPAFRTRMAEGLPARIGDDIDVYTGNVGTKAIEAEKDREFRVSTARAEGADKARITVLSTRAAALARGGQGDSDEYRQVVGEIDTIWTKRTENPISPYSKEEAVADRAKLHDDLTLEGIQGGIERAWEKIDGDPATRADKIRKLAEAAIERGGFQERAVAEKTIDTFVRSLAAEGRVEQAALKDEVEAAIEEYRANPTVAANPEDEILYERARKAGLHREAGQLRTAREAARLNGNTLLDPALRRDLLRGGTPGGDVVDKIIGVESRGVADAANPNSSALGAGQFIESTWLSTIGKHRPDLVEGKSREEILALRTDKNVSREMTAALASDNAAALQKAGLPVTAGSTYLAHFAGAGGAILLMNAPGDASAESVLGAKAVEANPFLKGKTVDDVIAWADKKMGGQPIAVSKEVLAAAERQQRMVDEDPHQIWNMTRGPADADQRYQDLNFADPAALGPELKKRVSGARFARELEGLGEVSAFAKGDADTFASAVASPDPKVSELALQTVAMLPADMLVPTLSMPKVKEAIIGAARSPDPEKYRQAMTYADQMWRQAPQSVGALLGGDTVKELQDWQALSKYLTPEELSDRQKRRNDPAVVKRRKELTDEGEKIARRKSGDTKFTSAELTTKIVDAMDDSILPWGEPAEPDSEDARIALTADYIAVFGERYAATENEAEAHRQTMERLRTVWRKSDLNGGRLTMYAPENFYQGAGDGSHEWMRAELEEFIKAKTASPIDPAKFETKLPVDQEEAFQAWKQTVAPKDSGEDYDWRGAFKAGAAAGADGHWPDTFKKPNHPTFSTESQYAKDAPDRAGTWDAKGNYVPPAGSEEALRYELVPDRQTKAEAESYMASGQKGAGPSYFVVVTRADGRQDFLRGEDGARSRVSWDRAEAGQSAEARFEQQRRWVSEGVAMKNPTWRERASMVGENFRRSLRGAPTRNVFASAGDE